MFRRPVRPLGPDEYRLDLSDSERLGVKKVCAELRDLVEREDPATGRLWPDAFRDDPQASLDYRRLVHDDLLAGRLAAIDTVASTIDADKLDHEQLEAWCGALNDLRLVLGDQLGVTEDLYVEGIDPADPRAPQLALYAWLTWLQGAIVEALASRL